MFLALNLFGMCWKSKPAAKVIAGPLCTATAKTEVNEA